MYVCVWCACLENRLAKKGWWIPWNWSYRYYWAIVWVQRIALMSFVRVANVLNIEPSLYPPHIMFLDMISKQVNTIHLWTKHCMVSFNEFHAGQLKDNKFNLLFSHLRLLKPVPSMFNPISGNEAWHHHTFKKELHKNKWILTTKSCFLFLFTLP